LFSGGFAATFPPVIPQHVIDNLVQSVDLPEFIGEMMALARRAGTREGLCPFRSEATPGFKVFPDHVHCFGCGARGNALEFLMQEQGLTFPEAVRALASRTGVELPTSKPSQDTHEGLAGVRDVLRRAGANDQQRLTCSPCLLTPMTTATADEARNLWNRRARPRMRAPVAKNNEETD